MNIGQQYCCTFYASYFLFTVATIRADIEHLNVDTEVQQRSSALFLLKLKESRQVSQVDVVQGWNGLFTGTVDRLQARVRDRLASNGVDPDDVKGLSEVSADLPHPFYGLETTYKRDKYYRDKMGLVVGIM